MFFHKSNSVYYLPNIQRRKANATLNKSASMTITDDLGFVKMQIDKINHSISREKEKVLKPWFRKLNNNIYISNGKTNHQIMRELSKKYKSIRLNKDTNKINWSKQFYFNKRQMNNIVDGLKISKKIKHKSELKKKVKEKGFFAKDFLSQTKDVSIDNLKINLIKSERDKVFIKENEYQKALEYEKKSINQDVEEFEKFKLEVKRRLKSDEITLIKLIQNNKALYEVYKKLSHEYKYIIEEIIRYIKIIINYKTYVDFIHKMLGGGSRVLNVNLNEYINYRNWSEKDLNKYIKNVLKELNIFIVELSLDEKAVDILSDNNKIDIVFSIMEDNILKIVEEKEEFEKEEQKNMEENMIAYNKLMKDYQNNKAKYDLYLKEYEYEKLKLKDVTVESELEEYNSYINILLEEISNYINNVDNNFYSSDYINNTLTSFNKTHMSSNVNLTGSENLIFYGNNVQKCINDLKLKEFMIENFINEIDKNINEDEKLVKKIMNEIKDEHKIENIKKEKKKLEIQRTFKRQKIIDKIKQITFKEKYKFKEPIPFNILKDRKKKDEKKIPQTTQTNLLFY